MNTTSIKTSKTAGDLSPSMTLAITSKAKSMIAEGLDVISMCAGEPDFDTPEVIKEAAIASIKRGETKYTPAAGRIDLRKKVAESFKRDYNIDYKATQIIVAPGGKFSLFSAIMVACSADDEVIIPTPSWLSYPEMVKATGAKSVFVETTAENDYCMTAEQLEAAITDKTKLLILNSPSNPIGNIYSKAMLEAIAEVVVKHDILVISDEIYGRLTYDQEFPHYSIASLNDDIYQRTITVNGFSKAYSMTGWRLGYLGAPEWLAKKISALQSHATSNPTTFAQAGALVAVDEGEEDVEMMRKEFSRRRDLIFELLSAIPGLKVSKPRGAFYIFPDISEFGIDAMTFSERVLAEENLAVIPGTPFGAPNNIRLSYACSEKNIIEAAQRLGKFCAKLMSEK